MAATLGFYRYRATRYTETSSRYGTLTITSTSATADDTDTYDNTNYSEYEKTETEKRVCREIMKESLQIPSFKIVKKLHNIKKVKSFVENKQMNFNIRNAL